MSALFCKRPMRSESFEEGRGMRERTKRTEGTQRVFSLVADAVMWVMHCRIVVAIGRFVKYAVLRRPRRTWWGVDLAAGKDRTVFWKPLRNGGAR